MLTRLKTDLATVNFRFSNMDYDDTRLSDSLWKKKKKKQYYDVKLSHDIGDPLPLLWAWAMVCERNSEVSLLISL